MWRRLPTALIHFILVELRHVYVAVFSWYHLMRDANVMTAMSAHYKTDSRLEDYFTRLFFWGSTQQEVIHCNNVSDVFFLAQAERNQQKLQFNGSSLTLPATTLEGGNIPWLVLSWSLPVGAAVLTMYMFFNFAIQRLWSFESARYLNFSWHLYKAPAYRWCVALMACGPVVLPFMWFGEIVAYNLWDNQLNVLRRCAIAALVLLWALNILAFPTTPVHYWQSNADFLDLRFRRSILHLFFGSNAGFGMKFVDALWTAQHGDLSRLKRYATDPDKADEMLRICRQAQKTECEYKANLANSTDEDSENVQLSENHR